MGTQEVLGDNLERMVVEVLGVFRIKETEWEQERGIQRESDRWEWYLVSDNPK